jgi:hypothetical protein
MDAEDRREAIGALEKRVELLREQDEAGRSLGVSAVAGLAPERHGLSVVPAELYIVAHLRGRGCRRTSLSSGRGEEWSPRPSLNTSSAARTALHRKVGGCRSPVRSKRHLGSLAGGGCSPHGY